MLDIDKIDHVGLRVSDRDRALAFYKHLGFALEDDAGFADGHPIIMRHAAGVVLNLLGPATRGAGENILMDVDEKYPGYTHMALKIGSVDAARRHLEAADIAITGAHQFGGMNTIFIRDPDRNVIELVERAA
jgi:lactoylglutathione lyase